MIDCCIIGSGPAGLQTGYFLKQKGVDFKILEKSGAVGNFFRQFPRHRTLISVNKPNTGISNPDTRLRYDWNSLINDEGNLFGNMSQDYFPNADDYVRYLEGFAEQLSDNIQLNCDITKISKSGDGFTLACADGSEIQARRVIVATGFGLPWIPDVPGIETVDNYADFDTDPERYKNKRVLILGKGNSAFETADSLVETAQAIHVASPDPVSFAWQTHYVGDLRAVNNNFLDTYQLKTQNAMLDGEITNITHKDGIYTVNIDMAAAEGHEIILQYDHIIACTGFKFDNSIFEDALRPDMCPNNKLPLMSPMWESLNTADLFFAGTITHSRDYRKTMSGFVHGFRHNVACLAEFIAMRANGGSYPNTPVSLDKQDIIKRIIDRISLSAGLFLQPGFLGDAIVLSGPHQGHVFEEIPVDWAQQKSDFAKDEFLQVTLEFGDFGENSFHVKRQHNIFGKTPDAFIHPVIRHYKNGELQSMTHLSDHLDADWRPDAEKDAGVGTITRITFADAGETLPPSTVVRRQLEAFFDNNALLGAKEITRAS